MRRGLVALQLRRDGATERAEARRDFGDANQLSRLIYLDRGHCKEAKRLTQALARVAK